MRTGSLAEESVVQNDWTEVYAGWHDQAVANSRPLSTFLLR